MPPTKKKPTNKKKKGGKQQTTTCSGGGSSTTPAVAAKRPNEAEVAAVATSPLEEESIFLTKPTISIECADSFASLFAADYPPKMTIRLYFKNNLSKKEYNLADNAYEDCSAHFNRGINQFYNMPLDAGPANSRWHIAQGALLDALEAAMRYPGVFLKTTVSEIVNMKTSFPRTTNIIPSFNAYREWTIVIYSARYVYLLDSVVVNCLMQRDRLHGVEQLLQRTQNTQMDIPN
jgi:hypothetical protein